MTTPKPRPSAYQWLWAEIKAGYLEQNRRYGQMKWHTPESPWQPRAKPPPKRGK